jgi:hypothetical protein
MFCNRHQIGVETTINSRETPRPAKMREASASPDLVDLIIETQFKEAAAMLQQERF